MIYKKYYTLGKNIVNKINKESILCYDELEAEKGVKELNKLNLEKEKLEAKIRALNL